MLQWSMKNFKRRAGLVLIQVLEWLIAIYMLLGGVSTAFSPTRPFDGALGAVFASRTSLVIIGVIIFLSGLLLLTGKIFSKKKLHGYGLLAIYLVNVFILFLEIIVFQMEVIRWVESVLLAALCAILWLRWKFKTEYIDMKEIRKLRQEVR